MKFDHVHFEPWEGSDYRKQDFKILVLGESHYDGSGRNDGQLTLNCLRSIVSGEFRHSYWTKAARILKRSDFSETDGPALWTKLAFYNFVQEFVGSKSRIRPTEEMWKKSGPAFQEVLEFLQPHFVLVTGKELWGHIKLTDGETIPITLPGISETRPLVRIESASRQKIYLFAIDHPSSPGWGYAKWTPWLAQARTVIQRLKKDSKAAG